MKKKVISFVTFGLLWLNLLLMQGCDLIDYHPYDVRISGQTNVNATNIERIERLCAGKDTLRFVATGDTQRWYDDTREFVAHVNQRDDIDFVLHGGDVSDFGVTDEFMWQRDILNKLRMPYVVLLGNHDCIGTGEEAFRKVFGEPNFSFIAARIKFVCLNTNALEFDYSRPVPDFEFMTNEITARGDDFDRTVVCMHVPPFDGEFNNNVANVFEYSVQQYPGLQFCTVAHVHQAKQEELFNDGVIYYMSDCIHHRNYYLFTITPEGYTYEVVNF